MSGATMSARFSSPADTTVLDDVVRLRFDAVDGARGVLPGHEPARVALAPGAVEVVVRRDGDEQTRFVATEGGMVWITARVVHFVTRWAAVADSLAELREEVALRSRFRRETEAEARAVAHRHEVATRRALAGLERKVQS